MAPYIPHFPLHRSTYAADHQEGVVSGTLPSATTEGWLRISGIGGARISGTGKGVTLEYTPEAPDHSDSTGSMGGRCSFDPRGSKKARAPSGALAEKLEMVKTNSRCDCSEPVSVRLKPSGTGSQFTHHAPHRSGTSRASHCKRRMCFSRSGSRSIPFCSSG